MSTSIPNAVQKDKFSMNRSFFIFVFISAVLALALAFSMTVAHAAPSLIPPQPTVWPPPPTPTPNPISRYGVNIDVPFDIDPICGFEITVISNVKPENFYGAPPPPDGPFSNFNPWKDPKIVNEPPGSNRWKLVFGNPDGSGPCFSRDRFSRNKDNTIFMLHFGFYVSEPVIKAASARFIAPGGIYVRCRAPISGLTWVRDLRAIQVVNVLDHELAVENIRWIRMEMPVPINDLMPVLTEHGTPIWLDNNIIPDAQGDQPGVLSIELPAELQGQQGHLVMSYDVRDVANPEQFSTVTLAVPLE